MRSFTLIIIWDHNLVFQHIDDMNTDCGDWKRCPCLIYSEAGFFYSLYTLIDDAIQAGTRKDQHYQSRPTHQTLQFRITLFPLSQHPRCPFRECFCKDIPLQQPRQSIMDIASGSANMCWQPRFWTIIAQQMAVTVTSIPVIPHMLAQLHPCSCSGKPDERKNMQGQLLAEIRPAPIVFSAHVSQECTYWSGACIHSVTEQCKIYVTWPGPAARQQWHRT